MLGAVMRCALFLNTFSYREDIRPNGGCLTRPRPEEPAERHVKKFMFIDYLTSVTFCTFERWHIRSVQPRKDTQALSACS